MTGSSTLEYDGWNNWDTVSVICKSLSNWLATFFAEFLGLRPKSLLPWRKPDVWLDDQFFQQVIEEISQSSNVDLLIWQRKVDLSHWQCQCCKSHNYDESIQFTGTGQKKKILNFTVCISLYSFMTAKCWVLPWITGREPTWPVTMVTSLWLFFFFSFWVNDSQRH